MVLGKSTRAILESHMEIPFLWLLSSSSSSLLVFSWGIVFVLDAGETTFFLLLSRRFMLVTDLLLVFCIVAFIESFVAMSLALVGVGSEEVEEVVSDTVVVLL